MAKPKAQPPESPIPLHQNTMSTGELIEQGKTLGRMEGRLDSVEGNIVEIKDDIKSVKSDLSEMKTTLDTANGSFKTMKWIFGAAVGAYILETILTALK